MRIVGEIAFCGFLAIVGIVALSELDDLGRSPFDYLGSADVPRVLAWLVIGLSLAVVAKLVISMIRGGDAPPYDTQADSAELETGGSRRVRQVAFVAGATFLYVLSIILLDVPYSISTALFLVCGIVALAPRTRRNWPVILGVSILIGGVGEFLFVRVLALPFPGF